MEDSARGLLVWQVPLANVCRTCQTASWLAAKITTKSLAACAARCLSAAKRAVRCCEATFLPFMYALHAAQGLLRRKLTLIWVLVGAECPGEGAAAGRRDAAAAGRGSQQRRVSAAAEQPAVAGRASARCSDPCVISRRPFLPRHDASLQQKAGMAFVDLEIDSLSRNRISEDKADHGVHGNSWLTQSAELVAK